MDHTRVETNLDPMPPLLRFAPSPTGPLHLGGLRTALFNHLFARKHGGQWILRIEDTDATRLVPGSVENIVKGLSWAGLQYDFGPGVGGPRGPYVQSQRLDLYHAYANRLLDSGDAYRCFCSVDELEAKKRHLRAMGSTSTYDRACRKLTEEEVARRVRAKERHVIRIDDTRGPSLPPFSDIIFGAVRDAQGSLPTDPILLKVDLFPTYHLASIVDDHEMGITHVLRGEEWLPSLPLHRSLYARLKLTEPKFGHLPLLLNPDGSKMSKRKGDVRVEDFEAKGWEPDAVLNWLANAGRNFNNPELSSESSADIEQLVDSFDLSNYTKRRAVLDPALLIQLNKGHIIKQISQISTRGPLLKRAMDILQAAYPDKTLEEDYVASVISTLGDRLEKISDLPQVGKIFFDDAKQSSTDLPCEANLYGSVINAFSSWLKTLDSLKEEELKVALKRLPDENNISKRQFMVVLRHALGEKMGPPIADIIALLGKEETIRRFDATLNGLHMGEEKQPTAIDIKLKL